MVEPVFIKDFVIDMIGINLNLPIPASNALTSN